MLLEMALSAKSIIIQFLSMILDRELLDINSGKIV